MKEELLIIFIFFSAVFISCTADKKEHNNLPSPSGQHVPIGDLPGWKQIFYDDFTKEAALGSWGSECDGGAIVYIGAEGQRWKSYPACFRDTYQKRPYRADSVLSVKDGVLNFFLHPVEGKPAGANPSPVINNRQGIRII